ncbi:MAG: HD domain-containing protein [Akkermansiaceae bacterium]
MLAEAIAFIVESEKLKSINRRSNPVGMARYENSAEHSWSVALAASVLVPAVAPHLDQLRVIKMLLIHDIVEIDAGDTFCYSDQTGKAEREQEAAERLFGLLPAETAQLFHDLWREFEDKETEESKFANAIDRLLPLIQNSKNGGGSWAEFNVVYDQVYQRNLEIKNASPELWDYTKKLIHSAHEAGILPKDRKNP